MGLIKAGISSIRGTLQNQYKDFIICDQLDLDTLVKPGAKRNNKFSSNKGQQNIISDGSVVVVGTGQCALIVEQGKVIDFSAEPGEYIWDTGKSPSMLNSGMEGLKGAFNTVAERFTAGGNRMVDQRVYFVNTRRIAGQKFGRGGLSFRDVEFGFTMKLGIHGSYTYQVVNPVFFFEQYVGLSDDEFTTSEIKEPLKNAVKQSLGQAFTAISRQGITYDQIEHDFNNVTQAIRNELKTEWEELRGITVVDFKGSVTMDDDSREKMEKFQEARIMSDPNMAAGRMASATGNAMEGAANNENGAMNGFIGMGMANMHGGGALNAAQTNAQAHQKQQNPHPQQVLGWTCECGTLNNGKFCSGCGQKAPSEEPSEDMWACTKCNSENTGKFCSNCGTPKPEEKSKWECSNCEKINEGKFCSSCGNPKPKELDAYCEKCGFEGNEPFKFCKNCGAENLE